MAIFAVCLVALASAHGTLYDELELSQTATTKQVKDAYRRLALKHHPDKTNLAGSTARFIRISEAYEVLSNPEKRAVYDVKLRRGAGSGPSSSSGAPYQFTFSLKDAFAIFERFVAAKLPTALGQRYKLAVLALSQWEGFQMPLPKLLQSNLLRTALDQVDWSALRNAAMDGLQKAFEKEDGSVDWLRVAGATAVGVSAVASALDAVDDGNRTEGLKSIAAKGLSWASRLLGAGDKDET